MVLEWTNGQLLWNPVFFRAAQDWEIESMVLFFDEIYATQVRPYAMDKLVWILSPSKGFQLKSYYDMLCTRHGCSRRFPWKCIWKTRVPYRVAFFTWLAALGKILTTDTLCKWDIIIAD